MKRIFWVFTGCLLFVARVLVWGSRSDDITTPEMPGGNGGDGGTAPHEPFVQVSSKTPPTPEILQLNSDRWSEIDEHTEREETCQELDPAVKNSGVTTRLCTSHGTSGCEGRFIIKDTRHDKCENNPEKATKSQPLIEKLKKTGPSSLRIRLIGPSIILPKILYHEKPCEYTAQFVLPSGVYRIEAEVWYENHKAFDEMSTTTPVMARLQLLRTNESRRGTKGRVIEGAEHPDPEKNIWHYNHPIHGKVLKSGSFRSSKNYIWDQFTLVAVHRLTCTRDDKAQKVKKPAKPCRSGLRYLDGGSKWVSTAVAPTLPPEKQFTHFERFNITQLFTWRPAGCYLPKIDYEKAAECLKNRRVAFIGDSHNRVTYVKMVNFLSPNETEMDPGVKLMNGIAKVVGKNTTLDLYNDIYLEKYKMSDLGKKYDTVAAGFGSWALGGGGKDAQQKEILNVGRWSFKKYSNAVSRVASELSTVRFPIWMSMPAYPPNQRRFAKLKGEYRTNPRIALFNDETARVMVSKNISFVDTFAPSIPLIHLSPDHNHHVGYVQDAILHELLSLLCG
eukprot:TRINITY_DN1660_c0_g1_i2.p1 TRINITY_DN1660_c0_g1~~TRINITY_DN1660_c0_g1_i2.p1  ORF type:complete len:574 (+),score=72.26 TRINITY_DN1660_c0_g1_i2:43-1722(+)